MLAANFDLAFNGNCETVFKFYQSVFGGEFDFVGRYKDIPGETIPESEKEKRYSLHLLGKYFEEANNIPILTEKPMWMRFDTFRFISIA